MTFDSTKVTEAKRAVQEQVYARIASYATTKAAEVKTILCLAGRAFDGEHAIIRKHLPGAFVMAVDQVDVDVPRGVALYVGNIGDVPHYHDVVNLDLCANLASPDTRELIADVSGRAVKWFAVCVAYGREKGVTGGAESRVKVLDEILGSGWHRVSGDPWTYVGGSATPMLVALYARNSNYARFGGGKVESAADKAVRTMRREQERAAAEALARKRSKAARKAVKTRLGR